MRSVFIDWNLCCWRYLVHTRIILFGNTSEPIGTLRTPGFLQKWLEPHWQFPADFEARALYNVLVCQLDHLEHKM